MSKQTMGNCTVTGVEAAFRTALLNCRINLFKQTSQITPKFNDQPNSIFEERKFFLEALKGSNPKENEYLDAVFNFYKCRKEQQKQLPKLNHDWNSWKTPLRKIIYIKQKNQRKKLKKQIIKSWANRYVEAKSLSVEGMQKGSRLESQKTLKVMTKKAIVKSSIDSTLKEKKSLENVGLTHR
ncbi:hypothetical protein [Enterococcus hirae]|nr:hypothetical protein [Enterococcus hirae]